jgi:hypothetical protein
MSVLDYNLLFLLFRFVAGGGGNYSISPGASLDYVPGECVGEVLCGVCCLSVWSPGLCRQL